MPIWMTKDCSVLSFRNVRALLTFLTRLGPTHNITLFHYRNHGAAEGRVLVGLQATDAKQNPDGLIETLEQISYPYAEITDNVGYKRFLK